MVPADSTSTPDGNSNPPQPAQTILPQVQPPTLTFILQLFLIPLLIVSCVIALFMGFRWLASASTQDPKQAIESLQKAEGGSWQKAYELADMLSSPDRQYDKLRSSNELAQQVAKVLERELDDKNAATLNKERTQRRIFLCRALGTFKVADGLPTLIKAMKHGNEELDLEVRLASIEAIALLANGVGAEKIQQSEAIDALIEASNTSGEATSTKANSKDPETVSTYNPYSEVRAVSAYALGVIGGPKAIARLEEMLGDLYPNARYNAATGLARAGSAKAIPVIKEMLDPENTLAVQDEREKDDRSAKRTRVLMGGLQATLALHKAKPEVDISELKKPIEALREVSSDLVQTNRGRLVQYAKETCNILFSEAK